MEYQSLKLIHIVSATVLTGTGAGLAYFMLTAFLSKSPLKLSFVADKVVLGDWIFTSPAVLIQLITGLMLVDALNINVNSPWFLTVIGLFVFIGVCWLPVVWIQYKIRYLAKKSQINNQLDPAIKPLMLIWCILGVLAFSALLIIYWLMVFKPLAMI